jgi:adenylate kinase
MQVVLEEARGSYETEIIVELQSDEPEDVDSNVDRIMSWVKSWKEDNASNP